MISNKTVSVIIPTYNRKDVVQRALNSLKQQTLPIDQYEVIVVDDGSADNTPELANQQFSFNFRYVRQENQGATIARNNGVEQSTGDIIVFIDDDVTISQATLEALANACLNNEKVVAMGTLISRVGGDAADDEKNTALPDPLHRDQSALQTGQDEYIHFVECNTELISVKRTDFFDIGMLKDPTNGRGWPNWDDVDFGYRSYLCGFKLMRVAKAIGEHWDYSLADRTVACRRWQRACKSAVGLFQTHPGLQPHIPMLFDKTPIEWGHDQPSLVIRKLARQMASSSPMLGSLEYLADTLEKHYPTSSLLTPLYRWISGGYMYRGYQEGLKEYGQPSK